MRSEEVSYAARQTNPYYANNFKTKFLYFDVLLHLDYVLATLRLLQGVAEIYK